jgi:hypothetical protein
VETIHGSTPRVRGQDQNSIPGLDFGSRIADGLVAMKLKPPHKAALIDACAEAGTCRLRCGKIVHRAFCQPQLRNRGSIDSKIRIKTNSRPFYTVVKGDPVGQFSFAPARSSCRNMRRHNIKEIIKIAMFRRRRIGMLYLSDSSNIPFR